MVIESITYVNKRPLSPIPIMYIVYLLIFTLPPLEFHLPRHLKSFLRSYIMAR